MKVLILTGMHRSGTSLVASALQEAGVDIGSQLLAPDPRNPRGFFEDVDFYRFHERALSERGQSPYVDSSFEFRPTAEERSRALSLIDARQASPLWGWKDPRTALFLDFWHDLLPEAHCLFLYRHPLEVLASLLRRGEAHTPGLLEGVASWTAYNAAILRFHRRHHDRCVLVHTYEALRRPEELARLPALQGLNLALDGTTLNRVFHPDELRRFPITPGLVALLRRIQPDASGLYDELQSSADMPDRLADAGPEPDLRLIEQAVAKLAGPPDPARSRGLLLLLLASLEPALIEGYYAHHGHYIRRLEAENAQLHTALGEMKAERQGVKETLANLQGNNHAKQEWIDAQAKAINELQSRIQLLVTEEKRLAAEVERAHKSWVFRLGQWLATRSRASVRD